MKQLERNRIVFHWWQLLCIGVQHDWYVVTAHWKQNWTYVVAAVLLGFVSIAFAEAVYAHTHLYAGYTKNEMLIFLLIGQLGYHILLATTTMNVLRFIQTVQDGNLDLLLIYPVPTEALIQYIRIGVVHFFKTALVPLAVLVYWIDWSVVIGLLSVSRMIAAIVIWVCGVYIFRCIQFAVGYLVFWFGQSRSIIGLLWDLDDVGTRIPLEGLPVLIKNMITLVIPVGIHAAVTTSVLFGKSSIGYALLFSIVLVAVFFLIRSLVWNYGVRLYSSASS